MEHLEALIVASVAERATTMQGVLVKAKAMQAYRTLEKYQPFCNINARFWGSDLADAMLGILPNA